MRHFPFSTLTWIQGSYVFYLLKPAVKTLHLASFAEARRSMSSSPRSRLGSDVSAETLPLDYWEDKGLRAILWQHCSVLFGHVALSVLQ